MTKLGSATMMPRPVHPSPAGMAASIPGNELRDAGRRPLRVLHPIGGSGTTLLVARSLCRKSIRFDTDPLATLLAHVWCADIGDSSEELCHEPRSFRALSHFRPPQVAPHLHLFGNQGAGGGG